MTRAVKAGLLTLLEFLFLVGLWMAFVSMPKIDELLVGLGAAAIGIIASAVVKEQGLARFSPKFKSLLLILWQPWYAITGTWAILKSLVRTILGKKSEAQFQLLQFHDGGNYAEAAAKRTLAITYMTIPPNFIIVGIDQENHQILVHQVEPTPVPLIAQKLGISQ